MKKSEQPQNMPNYIPVNTGPNKSLFAKKDVLVVIYNNMNGKSYNSR